MGFFSDLFSRIGRVVRGQASASVDVLEDATFESTLKQTVRDMKSELNRVIRNSAEAMSHHNRLEAEFERYSRQSADWKEKAKLALSRGNEELAKKALAKKAECDEQLKALQPGVQAARDASHRLKEQVEGLKRRIEEAERNAGTLIARKNAAKAQKKVSEALAGVGEANNAFAALEEFEDSVEREEARARAYETLSLDTEDSLAQEFENLDTSSVEDDLAALKAEMAGG